MVTLVPLFENDAAADDVGLSPEKLIDAIKGAISRSNVSSAHPGGDLVVTSIYLKLNAIVVISAGGGLDFRVPFIGMKVKVGASVAHEYTHLLEMTLEPGATQFVEVRDLPVADAIVDAVDTVRAVMAHAAWGDDPFVLRDSTVELKFGVKKDGNISLGIDGDLSGDITHTLRLAFGSSPEMGLTR